MNVHQTLKFGKERNHGVIQKEKMLVTSIFFFPNNVYKNFFTQLQGHQKLLLYRKGLTLYHTIETFTYPRVNFKKTFENIVGKGENAGYQHFLLFPQCFLHFHKQISIFYIHLNCRLQMLSIWTGLNLCRLVKS